MKDNFTAQAAAYAQFRPDYPDELVQAVVGRCAVRRKALDVATGNGQLAVKLAAFFEEVLATDISQKQLDNARQASNVKYRVGRAEQLDFPDRSLDLVTVAQALHWFDFDRFYAEVKRVLKPEGIFAAIGYGLFSSTPDADAVIRDFYQNITGPYWDPERRYIDEQYGTIPFPFEEIHLPAFRYARDWTFQHVMGYLGSWSAVQHYRRANGKDPLALIAERLERVWGAGTKRVVFPLWVRIGKLKA
jgi:ubiquinone/menaquinone biosynthesis C-methylase UbiE